MNLHSTSGSPAPAANVPAPNGLLLKLDAAAKFLSVSPRTLWSEARADRIPVVRIGRSVRFDVRDLVSYIDTHKSRGANGGAQ